MSRPGKIAQLPHDVRHRLNGRLRNGEPGVRLVAWLNTLPDVPAVLASRFAGRPITKQNLKDPGQPVPPELLVYLQTMTTLGEPKARTAPAAPVAGPEPSPTKSK